jgi:rsbT co-antagonist protein RsbR
MQTRKELARHLEFLGIDDALAARLSALRPILEQSSKVIVADFYRHLLSFPHTRRLLKDPERRERLLGTHREYLLSLVSPHLDDDYVEDRWRIGEAHEEAGLPPGWFLGAYAHYFSLLAFVIEDAVDGDLGTFRLLLVDLLRRLLLDAQLGLEAQVERHHRHLEYQNEELARMLRDVENR